MKKTNKALAASTINKNEKYTTASASGLNRTVIASFHNQNTIYPIRNLSHARDHAPIASVCIWILSKLVCLNDFVSMKIISVESKSNSSIAESESDLEGNVNSKVKSAGTSSRV